MKTQQPQFFEAANVDKNAFYSLFKDRSVIVLNLFPDLTKNFFPQSCFKFFKKIEFANKSENFTTLYKKDFFNIVFIFGNGDETYNIIESIRSLTPNKAIIVFHDASDTNKLASMRVDLVFTKEADFYSIYQGVSLLIDKQIEEDSLFQYILSLEKENLTTFSSPLPTKVSVVNYEHYEASEKISAINFIAELDDNYLNKIPLLEELMDQANRYIHIIANGQIELGIERLAKISYEIAMVIDHFVYFKILTDALFHLTDLFEQQKNNFLENENFEMIVDSLLSLEKDFLKWIDAVFISKTAQDINYFDTSFHDGVLFLESLVSGEEFASEDGMEFF